MRQEKSLKQKISTRSGDFLRIRRLGDRFFAIEIQTNEVNGYTSENSGEDEVFWTSTWEVRSGLSSASSGTIGGI